VIRDNKVQILIQKEILHLWKIMRNHSKY